MQKSALIRHLNPLYSSNHQDALKEAEQRKAMAAAAQTAVSLQESVVDKVLKLSIGKEEIATSKFRSLNFLQFLGVEDLRHLFVDDPTRSGTQLSYTSYHAVEDFQMAPNTVVERAVLAKVKASPTLGVMTDERTDITVTRKRMVYVKVLDCGSGKVQELYLCDVDLEGSESSEDITAKLLQVLHEKEVRLQKVTGLGTNGAPVMTGRRAGVGARL